MSCPHRASQSWFRRCWIAVTHSAFVFGLLSLIWFLFRTGTKPSRAAYPCQRAAAVSGYAWLAAYVLPLLPFAKTVRDRSLRRSAIWLLMILVLVTSIGWVATTLDWRSGGMQPMNQMVFLDLASTTASIEPASDVFVVQNAALEDGGIPALIETMASHGLDFYLSDADAPAAGSTGLIPDDAVVLIKVNCQWAYRGGTNTDLLKALIQAVLNHPDGFRGEIVVADNGQRQYGSAGRGGMLSWAQNNAVDHAQSIQKVVDSFSGEYSVSACLWDAITQIEVEEYDTGNLADGYVVVRPIDERSQAYASYPKFRTAYGTCVSFRNGIWEEDLQSYDSDRLVLINVPVLKPHLIYGVTASVKHYMGVTSDYLTRRLGARAHDTITAGGMGTAISGSRIPALNILDALWVSLEPGMGPSVGYDQATLLRIVAASTDPVALDCWAARHILMAGARELGFATNTFDPDSTGVTQGAFSRYLDATQRILEEDGFSATKDEAAMNIIVKSL